MKSCQEIAELVSAYIDNELDDDAKKEFDEHIAKCDVCSQELSDMLNIVGLCNELPEEELPEQFTKQLHDKLLEAKESTKGTGKITAFKNRYFKILSSAAAVFVLAAVTVTMLSKVSVYDMIKDENFTGSEASTLNSAIMPETSNFCGENQKTEAAEGARIGDENREIDLSKDIDFTFDASKITTTFGNSKDVSEPYEGSTAAVEGTKVPSSQSTKSSEDSTSGSNTKVAAGTTQFTVQATAGKSKNWENNTTQQNGGQAKGYKGIVGKNSSPIPTISPVLYASNVAVGIHADKPEAEVEKVKALAQSFGSEIMVYATDQAVTMKNAPQVSENTVSITESSANIININIRIKNSEYDSFINSLEQEYGQGNIRVGTVKQQELTSKINSIENQMTLVTNQINTNQRDPKYKSDGNSDLVAQEEALNNEVNRLKAEAEYTTITLTINRD